MHGHICAEKALHYNVYSSVRNKIVKAKTIKKKYKIAKTKSKLRYLCTSAILIKSYAYMHKYIYINMYLYPKYESLMLRGKLANIWMLNVYWLYLQKHKYEKNK